MWVSGLAGDGWIGWWEWMQVMDVGGDPPARNPTCCQAYLIVMCTLHFSGRELENLDKPMRVCIIRLSLE